MGASQTQQLCGARIFDGQQWLENKTLLIEGERISALLDTPDRDIPCVDLAGKRLVPGFVDLQVNGGAGVLFNDDPSVAAIETICRAHRNGGVTSLLVTLISDRLSVVDLAIDAVEAAIAANTPGLLGLHLEGPYLNPVKRGVHPAEVLIAPEARALDQLSRLSQWPSMVTLAPEQVPEGFIGKLSELGVRVSIGHSNAEYEQVIDALAEGATGFTHLYNAMSGLNSRAPGVVGAALADAQSWCGIIVDFHHVHPGAVKVALAAKPPGKVCLVSDAVHSVGAQSNQLMLLGQPIVRSEGRVNTLDGTLAGADLTLLQALRNCVVKQLVPLEEALRMASIYPASWMGLEGKIGRIAPGYRADLLLLDEQLQLHHSWIGGQGMAH